MKSLRCPISRQARLTRRGVRNDSRLSSHGYGGWVDMWQSVCDASTVVGLQLGPKFLASLIQHILGIVFELSSQSFFPLFLRAYAEKKKRPGPKRDQHETERGALAVWLTLLALEQRPWECKITIFLLNAHQMWLYERMWKHEKFKLNQKLHSCAHLEIRKSVEQTWQHSLKS